MRRLLVTVAVLSALAAPAAHAGQGCTDKQLSPGEVVRSMDLAQRTVQALDASGAGVALLARAGQDLSKYGLRYSHMAIAVRDHPKGRWTVVHELNECGTAASSLYDEGVGNFLLTDLYHYEVQVLVPGKEAQARLLALMATRAPLRLHEPHYNMLSYVYSTRYQNSNQWVLEVLAAAASQAGEGTTRTLAQGWLKDAGYEPLTIDIPAATRLGARLFRANVAFDDHPFDRRMAGRIDTVTTEAITRFVLRRDREARLFVVE
jgi:hypothetical protein